jgi:hypothetical protein
MQSFRSGLLVIGCVFVGFVVSAGPGLVARAAEPERWLPNALAPGGGTSVPVGEEPQRRIAQLEQRLKELGGEPHGAAPGRPTPGRASGELDTLIARNQELVERNLALSAENQALAQSHLFEPPVAATPVCEPPPDAADPRAQLRYWAERLRDGESSFRSGLTPDQSAALNVLLRRERTLDPRNPWRNP